MTVNRLFGTPGNNSREEKVSDPPTYQEVRENGERYGNNGNSQSNEQSDTERQDNYGDNQDLPNIITRSNYGQVFIDIEPATPTP